LRSGINEYIRDGEVRRGEDGRIVFLFGIKLYDPRAFDRGGLFQPYDNAFGRPNEIVFHIAGETYFPTKNGYVRL
jgi:hypothetical protein